ncbi:MULTISPECIES: demethoxyubiquinone hydroxylase family protein [Eubacterium]|uniref:Ubiquinone biosynthesis protein COQ7 n=2 Tax=Eubacterium TaxID=1730 RepID=A0A1H3XLP3_9FIRM|nr:MULTISPECIES: demethoxyubiquinone hydroxylase family protein [Eubacterium]MEA5072657.1 demethoxyubiquinone hydroxylase family protein [Eubacterium aggregans]SDX76686.1 Ubiquinone biosynthesis protein COQ7 [Eubacterium barkeri]SEA00269.1 Ubiquinone biosynthesis protein COQ7 [Eubacterium aggregans]
MPQFGDPFAGNVERKMNKKELAEAIRLDLAGELEAIYLYDAHVRATDNAIAKKVLADIRDEEKAHIGELTTLMRYLDAEEYKLFESGAEEVHEMMRELGIPVDSTDAKSPEGATIGSLKEE